MSDIAITLSVDLWQKISSGDKPFEVRKQVPACFNYNRDRVYVILKGYKEVVGYFKVGFFARNQDPSKIWENHADKIGVKQDWWWKWVGNSRYVQVWMVTPPCFAKSPTTSLRSVAGALCKAGLRLVGRYAGKHKEPYNFATLCCGGSLC